jgi:hypothetical protein
LRRASGVGGDNEGRRSSDGEYTSSSVASAQISATLCRG